MGMYFSKNKNIRFQQKVKEGKTTFSKILRCGREGIKIRNSLSEIAELTITKVALSMLTNAMTMS